MVEARTVEDRVAPLAERVAVRLGCEFVHCEYVHESGRWFLRVFIEREGGVTIDDCTKVSRQVSALLDVENVVPQAYHLEVSSPGLDRPLNTAADYERFAGEAVRIKTTAPVDGRRKFRGVLKGLDRDVVTLTDDAGRVFEIPLDQVKRTRLDPVL